MLVKLNQILILWLVAFLLSIVLYPIYIRFLKYIKAGKQIREDTTTWERSKIFAKLHQHKKWTPTMWWWLFLIIMWVMIGVSYLLKSYDLINNALLERWETYIILFWFFSMGLLGLLDDYLNIKWHSRVKGLNVKMKLIGMFIFASFISWWFYTKLGISTINFWPIAGNIELWLFAPIITFFVTVLIVNAINIADWLDWLAGGLVTLIFLVLSVVTFMSWTYISSAIVVIFIAILIAFLWFNINPAKVFMWDSWAFAIGWFLSSLIFVLNMKIGILIPFLVIFLLFSLDVFSSIWQLLSKKILKRKLFTVAPLHHLFEHKWVYETTIVMKAWLIQWILAVITLIIIFYQMNNSLI